MGVREFQAEVIEFQVDSELGVSPASLRSSKEQGHQWGSSKGQRINGKLGNSGFSKKWVTLVLLWVKLRATGRFGRLQWNDLEILNESLWHFSLEHIAGKQG